MELEIEAAEAACATREVDDANVGSRVNEIGWLPSLGATIRRRRLELKRSQADLAGAVAVTQASISNYETGRREPPLSLLLCVWDELDLSPFDLLWQLESVRRARQARLLSRPITLSAANKRPNRSRHWNTYPRVGARSVAAPKRPTKVRLKESTRTATKYTNMGGW